MPRYRLLIEYDGTPFSGWQRQATDVTVQGVLEEAIAKVAEEPVGLRGAGRTDAGVHARGQVAHLDMAKALRPDKLRDAINAHVRPWPVAVLEAALAGDDFDARFSATRRHYEYRIIDRRAPVALERGRVWHVPKRLDHAAMHAAGQLILGKHDFTTFRAAECQAQSPVKTLDRLDVLREGDTLRILTHARSFLHNQVRSMVGSLKLVGEGKWTPADFRAALDARDRTRCGMVAPPGGLYLMAVEY